MWENVNTQLVNYMAYGFKEKSYLGKRLFSKVFDDFDRPPEDGLEDAHAEQ